MVSIMLIHPGQFSSTAFSNFLVSMVLKSPWLQCWQGALTGSENSSGLFPFLI